MFPSGPSGYLLQEYERHMKLIRFLSIFVQVFICAPLKMFYERIGGLNCPNKYKKNNKIKKHISKKLQG